MHIDDYQRRITALEKVSWRLAFWRRNVVFSQSGLLGAFVLAILAAIFFVDQRSTALIASALLFAGWLTATMVVEQLTRRTAYARARKCFYEQAIACKQRQWKRMDRPQVMAPSDAQALVNDLHLFGGFSLFRWVCRAQTVFGVRRLSQWLLHGAAPEVIQQRQSAARQLAPQTSFREKVFACGRLVNGSGAISDSAAEDFVEWAKDSPALTWWMKKCVALLALSPAAAAGVWAFGLLSPTLGGVLFLVSLLVNFFLSIWFAPWVHEHFDHAAAGCGQLTPYSQLIGLAASVEGDAPPLAVIRRQARAGERKGRHPLQRLQRITYFANLRRLPMLWIVVQLLMLWDFHLLAQYDRWRAGEGGHVELWMQSVGDLEALCSLAAVAAENSTWAFPHVEPAPQSSPQAPSARFAAQGLGHPLISDDERVVNDASLPAPGGFLLVTGSNMSGKSTFLRSIGLNITLAQMGAPVCARELHMNPLRLAASMQARDSLQEGVSFFLAELTRLKEVVEAAHSPPDESRRTLCFLLDEVLQGTDSHDRQIAVARVLAHLLERRAIGAISTHDRSLASHPSLGDLCQAVHFREQLRQDESGVRMEFDYRLHPGVAQTTNALRLLDAIGL